MVDLRLKCQQVIMVIMHCNLLSDLYPTDVLFTGIRSYIRLKTRTLSSVALSLELEIKPGKARGLIFYAETPHFYTALSLQGALLEYRWTGMSFFVAILYQNGYVKKQVVFQYISAKCGLESIVLTYADVLTTVF